MRQHGSRLWELGVVAEKSVRACDGHVWADQS